MRANSESTSARLGSVGSPASARRDSTRRLALRGFGRPAPDRHLRRRRGVGVERLAVDELVGLIDFATAVCVPRVRRRHALRPARARPSPRGTCASRRGTRRAGCRARRATLRSAPAASVRRRERDRRARARRVAFASSSISRPWKRAASTSSSASCSARARWSSRVRFHRRLDLGRAGFGVARPDRPRAYRLFGARPRRTPRLRLPIRSATGAGLLEQLGRALLGLGCGSRRRPRGPTAGAGWSRRPARRASPAR